MRAALLSLCLSAAPAVLMVLGGCSSLQHWVVDTTLSSAPRPDNRPRPMVLAASPKHYEVLAGDLHCHVNPPDHAPHVVRDLSETAELAASEKLDFVVLTPHVWARFFASEALRAKVIEQQAALRAAIAALPDRGTMFIPGIEYTDGQFGHVGVSFSNLEQVLAGLPVAEAREHPERFFERHVEAGGLLVVNHPFTTPVNFIVSIARADLSWRPFLREGPFPPEIEAVSRLAHGYEAYNLTTTELRDRFLLFDRDWSIRQTLGRLDTEIVKQHWRMAPVGGRDSHGHHLWATTFVLSEARTPQAVHHAIVAGRTCIRDPAACSFRARSEGGEWVAVGGSLEGVAAVEVAADGGDIEVRRDGQVVAQPGSGASARVEVPVASCSVLRARVGQSESASIYVNCGLPPG